MAGNVQSPEKELRFTRAGQAKIFWLLAAVLAAVGITMLATAPYRDINPDLPHPAWAAVPLVLALVVVRLAVGLTRHAYFILTPLGIEIFPFLRPAQGMRLVLWHEIDHAEIDEKEKRLTLHHDAARTSGIHLSLAPISANRLPLLITAINGRMTR